MRNYCITLITLSLLINTNSSIIVYRTVSTIPYRAHFHPTRFASSQRTFIRHTMDVVNRAPV